MKRTVLYGAFLVGCLSLAACQQHKESKTSEPDLTGKVAETSQITDCEIKVGDQWRRYMCNHTCRRRIGIQLSRRT